MSQRISSGGIIIINGSKVEGPAIASATWKTFPIGDPARRYGRDPSVTILRAYNFHVYISGSESVIEK